MKVKKAKRFMWFSKHIYIITAQNNGTIIIRRGLHYERHITMFKPPKPKKWAQTKFVSYAFGCMFMHYVCHRF